MFKRIIYKIFHLCDVVRITLIYKNSRYIKNLNKDINQWNRA